MRRRRLLSHSRGGSMAAFSAPTGKRLFDVEFADFGYGQANIVPAKVVGEATFARSTTAATRLSDGTWLLAVPANWPRSYYAADGTYCGYLPEPTRTNRCLQSRRLDVTHHLTVSAGSGTFTEGETVNATGGGSGVYRKTLSSVTVFALTGGSGTMTGTLTGATSAATKTIDSSATVWVTSDCTVTGTGVGIDGETNAASIVTATGANATVLQAITSASVLRSGSVFVKRVTGTGVIEMTLDNGSTWTAITTIVDAGAVIGNQRAEVQQTVANPTIGFRIVTSGDAIRVDCVQEETGGKATTPIVTKTVAVNRLTDNLTYQTAGNVSTAAGSLIFDAFKGASPAVGFSDLIASGSVEPLYLSFTLGKLKHYNGTNDVNVADLTTPFAAPKDLGVTWNAANAIGYLEGLKQTTSAVTVTPTFGATFTVGGGSVGTSWANGDGGIRRLRAYRELTDAEQTHEATLATRVTVGTTDFIQAHGDSITFSEGATVGYLQYLQRRLARTSSRYAAIRARGTSGQGFDYVYDAEANPNNLVDEAAAQIDAKRDGALTNWLIIFAGTNDMWVSLGNSTAAATYGFFEDYISARITASWVATRIIVCTMLPREEDDTFETKRQTYNASLVSGATTYGYRLARLDLDTRIGVDGNQQNATYYQDAIHPTNAGHAIIAEIIERTMLA